MIFISTTCKLCSALFLLSTWYSDYIVYTRMRNFCAYRTRKTYAERKKLDDGHTIISLINRCMQIEIKYSRSNNNGIASSIQVDVKLKNLLVQLNELRLISLANMTHLMCVDTLSGTYTLHSYVCKSQTWSTTWHDKLNAPFTIFPITNAHSFNSFFCSVHSKKLHCTYINWMSSSQVDWTINVIKLMRKDAVKVTLLKMSIIA